MQGAGWGWGGGGEMKFGRGDVEGGTREVREGQRRGGYAPNTSYTCMKFSKNK